MNARIYLNNEARFGIAAKGFLLRAPHNPALLLLEMTNGRFSALIAVKLISGQPVN